MKRLSMFLVLCLVVLMAVFPVIADEEGDGWSVVGNTLTISGTEIIEAENRYDLPWSDYNGSVTKIVIENGVPAIGDYYFTNFYSVTSVSIPASVTSIGSYAFAQCQALVNITIPNTVSYIAPDAFSGTVVNATKGSYAEQWAVENRHGYHRSGDKNYTLIEGVLYSYFGTAKTFTIPKGTIAIADGAFYRNKTLTSVSFNQELKKIGNYAFYQNYGLTTLNFPSSLEAIGDEAFYNCIQVFTINLPEELYSVGFAAFDGIQYAHDLTIPESLTEIGKYAFHGILMKVYENSEAHQWAIENKVAFHVIGDESDFTIVGDTLYAYAGQDADVVIPDGVKYIGDSAFAKNRSLVSVTIPDGVEIIGQQAFYDCHALQNVSIPDSVTTIGISAFYNCFKLSEITLPANLGTISGYSLGGTGLTNLVIPDGVTRIDYSPFYHSQIRTITVPESVTDIYYSAFSGMTYLKKIRGYEGSDIQEFAEDNDLPFVVIGGNVSEITMTAPEVSASGKTFTVEAITNNEAETLPALNWSLSDSSLAEITATGTRANNDGDIIEYCTVTVNQLNALSSLNVIATANDSGAYSDSVEVSLMPVEISKFSIIAESADGSLENVTGKTVELDLASGGELKLTAMTPDDTAPAATWKSSAVKVMTIAADGTVSGVKAGTATITATLTGTKTTATVKVKAVSKVQPGSLTITGGDEVTVKKTLKLAVAFDQSMAPTNKNVVWTSLDTASAKVSNKGVVTGVAGNPDGVVIQACPAEFPNDSDYCDTVTVYVRDAISSFAVVDGAGEDGSMAVDLNYKTTYDLDVNVQPATAIQSANWKSSAPKIATVDEDGVVTFLGNGTVTITATSKDGTRKSAVKLTAKTSVLAIELTGPETLIAGKAGTFTANVIPATASNKKVTWSVMQTDGENPDNDFVNKVAAQSVTVKNGKATAGKKAAQGAMFRVIATSAEDASISDNAVVTISVPTTSVEIRFNDHQVSGTNYFRINENNEVQFEGHAEPEGVGQSFAWKSSAPKIATVDATGKVTFLKDGTTTITATALDGSGKKATAKITGMTVATDVTVTGPDTVVPGKTATYTATVSPDNAGSKAVVWSVTMDGAATKLATIKNGKLTVVKTAPVGTVLTVQAKSTYAYGPEQPVGTIEVTVNSGSTGSAEFEPEAVDEISIEEPIVEELDEVLEPTEAVVEETTVTEEVIAEEEITEPEETPAEDEIAEAEEAVEEETGPRFAVDEQYLLVGESLILDVINPDEDAVIVGISGDTDAVLWNEAYNMLTSIGEAEVTAFLSTVDPVEIKDMLAIHIVTELPVEAVTEAAESVESEETAEAAEPVEAVDEVVEETPAEEPISEDVIEPSADVTEDDAEAEPEATEEPADETPATEPASEEAPAEEAAPEIVITDLGEYDALEGVETAVITIERERFELDDELMRGMIFEVEDESVAKLTERSADEITADGIELSLMTAGETKLTIRREGDTEPLREIYIVVSAAPVVEEPAPDAEPVAEEAQPVASEPAPEEAPAEEPVLMEEAAAEPEAEAEPESIEEFAPEPEQAEEPLEADAE